MRIQFIRLILLSQFVAFWLVTFLISDLSAQHLVHTSYDKTSGLLSDYVFSIYQDRDGYMWFGTDYGASRYDGNTFQSFTKSDGLPANYVYDFYHDQNGRLWLVVVGNTPAYIRNDSLHILDIPNNQGKSLINIIDDSFGRIYLIYSNGILLWYKYEFAFYPFDKIFAKETSLIKPPDGRILLILEDHIQAITPTNNLILDVQRVTKKNGIGLNDSFRVGFFADMAMYEDTLYVVNFGGLSVFKYGDKQLEQLEKYAFSNANQISIVKQINTHKVIIGTRNHGLYTFNLSTQYFEPIHTFSYSNDHFIMKTFVDYEQNLWVSFFGEGVYKVNHWSSKVYNKSSGLANDIIWRHHQIGNHIFTSSPSGLSRINLDETQKSNSVSTFHLPNVRGYQADISNTQLSGFISKRGSLKMNGKIESLTLWNRFAMEKLVANNTALTINHTSPPALGMAPAVPHLSPG